MTSRATTFLEILSETEQRLPLYSFRHLCAQGIPDSPRDLRARAYRVLLGLVDVEGDKREWPQQLAKKRAAYYDLAEEVCSRVDNDERQDRLLAQILSDVVRTQSSFAFFLEPKEAPSFPSRRALLERLDAIKGQSPTIPQLNGRLSVASTSSRVSLNSLASSSASPMTSATSYQSDTEALWEGLFRLLFVFASLNPTIGYVQGINELAAPLLYVFGQHDAASAEADCFWALSSLLGCGLGDLLSPENDQSRTVLGLGMVIVALADSIDEQDKALSQHLQDTDVRPSFYAVRWFLAAFAQDFALPDLLRLWDALLAEVPSDARDPPREVVPPAIRLLVDIATVIVVSLRDQLIGRSFPVCLRIIQSAPATMNVDDLLTSAFIARQQRQARAFERETMSSSSRYSKALASLPSTSQASSWFSRKVTSFNETDASASLSKAATNLAVRSKQLRESAPGQFEQLKASVATRAATAKAYVRPPSPEYDAPFRPPGHQSPPTNTTASPRHVPDYLATPPTVKPLLLSSAARRAAQLSSEDGEEEMPRGSRRSSWLGTSSPMPYNRGGSRPASPATSMLRSPSTSPELPLEDLRIISPRLQAVPRSTRRSKQASSSSAEADEPFVPPVYRESGSRHTNGERDAPFVPPSYEEPVFVDDEVVPSPRRSSIQPLPSPALSDRALIPSVLHDFPSIPPSALEPAFEPTPMPSPSRRGFSLIDAPASRLSEAHPSPPISTPQSFFDSVHVSPITGQAPPSSRPPRGTSLPPTSPVTPSSAGAPLRRSRVLASARKRLSGKADSPRGSFDDSRSSVRMSVEGSEGVTEDDVLAYYR